MQNLLLLLTIVLIIWTVLVFIIYYRRLQKLSHEYEKAKNVVEDIVISFNKDLKGKEAQIGRLYEETRTLSSQNEKVLRITRKFERSLKHLGERVKGIPEAEQKAFSETHDLGEKLHLVVDTQEKLTKKLKKLEKMVLKPSAKPESGIETVIPLKKEKALEPLTNTEFRVLNVLATDGKKTSPEIQNEIRLTREHTARLMKKLYQKGYLERDIKKIPYVYWIKQEMLKLLKKA